MIRATQISTMAGPVGDPLPQTWQSGGTSDICWQSWYRGMQLNEVQESFLVACHYALILQLIWSLNIIAMLQCV